ncbi:MAG: hypothetical protein ACP5SH_00925 [Syntrophobacteraceae bacterium]
MSDLAKKLAPYEDLYDIPEKGEKTNATDAYGNVGLREVSLVRGALSARISALFLR